MKLQVSVDLADMIGVHDRGKRAAELEKMGVNYLEIHCGLDEQAHGFCSVTFSPPCLRLLVGLVQVAPLCFSRKADRLICS